MKLEKLIGFPVSQQQNARGSGQISSRPISNRPISLPQKVAFWKGNGTPAISGKLQVGEILF